MRILLYNPDNGVTRNFMPHLWMFLLQALTPPGHEVSLIDGNTRPMDEEGIAHYVRKQSIGLVGIGGMTRMIAKAYRVADAVRAAGVKVVMGGPASPRWPTKPSGGMAARAMPTLWLLAKPMRRGPELSGMRHWAHSRRFMHQWTTLAKNANRHCKGILRFPGTESILINSI